MESFGKKKKENVQDEQLSPEKIADAAGGSIFSDVFDLVKRGVCAVSGHYSSTSERFRKDNYMYTKYRCEKCGQWIYEKRYYTSDNSEEISEAEYNANETR